MKKEMKILGLFSIILGLFLVSQVSAVLGTQEYINRLEFGHVVVIKNISTEPGTLIPGEGSVLKMVIENTGAKFINDIVITFNSTDEIVLINDYSRRKISRLESGESKEITFDIIVLPNIGEGVYKPGIVLDYVNHIGEERQDVGEIGLAVKGAPVIFAKVDSTEIHSKNKIGEVSIMFVNNDVADMKFLTVELLKSKDYKIINSGKEYVGDLDSDDFESVDFRISLKSRKDKIPLPLKITYTDALNNKKSENIETILTVFSAKELGIKSSGSSRVIVIIVILCGVGYYFYKRYKKKKKRKEGHK
tara:strand:+ start:4779 stop:5693 length:915 start_codon:yes stop_codon:yes gene_type:complete